MKKYNSIELTASIFFCNILSHLRSELCWAVEFVIKLTRNQVTRFQWDSWQFLSYSVCRHSRAAWALSEVHGLSEQTPGLQWLVSGSFPASPLHPRGMPSDLGLNLITTNQNHLLQRTGWCKIFMSPAVATGRDQGSNYGDPWETRSAL